MYCTINAPGNGNNVVDVINATYKIFLKGKWNFFGKLASNDTSNIIIIPSA